MKERTKYFGLIRLISPIVSPFLERVGFHPSWPPFLECIIHNVDLALVGEDTMLVKEIDLIINPGSAIPTFFVNLVFVPVIRHN